MKFIDLFAGLGGFHVALKRLGHKCVYACEIEPTLNRIYKDIHGIQPDFDIKEVDLSKIPHYEILCAGFPCQPFSKAGSQSGFDHKVAGDMFEILFKFLKTHKPKYFILENVPNLIKHDHGYTWLYMKSKLESISYKINFDVISPTNFNIPQTRERVYILGALDDIPIKWPIYPMKSNITIKDILIDKPKFIKRLNKSKKEVLDIWQDFLNCAPDKNSIISPLWSMEFGATYPFEETTPFALGTKKLKKYKGSFGIDLSTIKEEKIFENIPPYSHYSNRKNESDAKKIRFPAWKINFIKRIRNYYEENKPWIDDWLKRTLKKEVFQIPSFQKFEWNCNGDILNLNDKLISFRSSGVRVKRLDNAPTLVNLSLTSLPYLSTSKRYLTIEECLVLQGFHEIKYKILSDEKYLKKINRVSIDFVLRALGNAVNVDVVEQIAKTFLSKKNNILHRKVDAYTQIGLNFNKNIGTNFVNQKLG